MRTESLSADMDVSVIIPVYQRLDWIGRCIHNLLEQSFDGTIEIIVVDDGSPNGSEIETLVKAFPSKGGKHIRYIRQQQGGPAAARNYGVRFSTGKILCFLDDDSIVDIKWIYEITAPFRHSSSVAVVSGQTRSLDRQNRLSLLLEKAVYTGKNWATCNIAYRRDIFEAVGGFDESFPEASWEDNDLGLRVRWAGYSHIYNENAIVYHPHENSISEYKQKCLRNGRGAAVFSRKYILKKPLWGIGTPLIMSRRLIYGMLPSTWIRKDRSIEYLRFLWSFYSIQGFISALVGKNHDKN